MRLCLPVFERSPDYDISSATCTEKYVVGKLVNIAFSLLISFSFLFKVSCKQFQIVIMAAFTPSFEPPSEACMLAAFGRESIDNIQVREPFGALPKFLQNVECGESLFKKIASPEPGDWLDAHHESFQDFRNFAKKNRPLCKPILLFFKRC